jgi:preprotein translocase subunit SecG
MLTYYLIVAVHVLVCLVLILVVLLQSGKGADLAGAFGGGATQTAFGSRGPASLLSKITTGAAVVFMLTSITLARMHPTSQETSILDTAPGTTAPQPKAPAVQPPSPPPTPEEIKKLQKEIEEKQQQAPKSETSQQQGTESSAPGVKVEVKQPGKSGEASPPSGEKP